MAEKHPKQAFYAGKTYRIVSAVFGLILLLTGLYALVLAQSPAALRIAGGLGLILLGGNLVWSACKAKESWASRIGPLP